MEFGIAGYDDLVCGVSFVFSSLIGSAAERSTASMVNFMMMIAFITIKSSLVPLIEGLCAQI